MLLLCAPHLFIEYTDVSHRMFPTPPLMYRLLGSAVLALGVGNALCFGEDAAPEARIVVGSMTAVYSAGTLVVGAVYWGIHPSFVHVPVFFSAYLLLQVVSAVAFAREALGAAAEISAKSG